MRHLPNAILILTFILASLHTAFGANSVRNALAAVPPIEMPAQAADIVRTAKPGDRSKLAVEVVRVGLSLNPIAASSLVTAISKAVPEVAGSAAGAAAEVHPKQALEIAKAAATEAPQSAGQIVAAVCRVVPLQYKEIAEAVAKVCPAAGKEILQAVASTFPELKADINKLLANYGAKPPSVAAVIAAIRNVNPISAESSASVEGASRLPTTSPGARGPTVAPPYVPYSSSGPNVTPSTSGTVPRGQRTYASP